MAINETASDVVLHVVPWDHPHAEQLRAAQRADIVARYGGNFEPGHRPTAADIAVFVVAYDGATPIGCGAFRDLVDEQPTVEVKRMYVRPEYRGERSANSSCATLRRGHVSGGRCACDSRRGLGSPKLCGSMKAPATGRSPTLVTTSTPQPASVTNASWTQRDE